MKRFLILILTIAAMTTTVFADWKLSQKIKITGEEVGRTSTIYQKGVRQRRVDKMDMGKEAEDPEMAEMMAQMGAGMPTLPTLITQCDLKQDIFLNEKNKAYFVDYYDWSTVPPEKLQRRPAQKMVVKGTMTSDTVVTDSGKRQQMFGLTARWLKVVQTVEESADSCNGYSLNKIVQEGWFVTLSLESESCPIRQPRDPGNDGGCRSKLVLKRAQSYGFMLTGTMRMNDGSDAGPAFETETLELSKATLDPALFEIPKDFVEVDSQAELSTKRGPVDTSAKTVYSDGSGPKTGVKTIAIDFFSGGGSSKVDQGELRNYVSGKLAGAGLSGFLINSQADLLSGSFANVIGVELKKVKESGAAKLGGLFSKVTGDSDASKIGSSEAEIVITIYGKDGKSVVASATATKKVDGKANDAVKAAIDQIMGGLLLKIK